LRQAIAAIGQQQLFTLSSRLSAASNEPVADEALVLYRNLTIFVEAQPPQC
jgi:hypothetical protein